ncbi:hypothetical protein TUE45_pSRTUE45c_0013 (plasmid) [Streptomyces reticuli]|nr:hypothetical protein TUE45_pSRTUE45c_0013 [Streptomyces reticuli]
MLVMDGRRIGVTSAAGHVCGSCKKPVDTVVERYKSFGVFVPAWTAGPCRNPQCAEYVPEYALIGWARGVRPGKSGRGTT